jgi:hypothetical protein
MQCARVVSKLAKNLIHGMYYDARVRCVINWYAREKRIPLPKPMALLRLLTRQQYYKVSILLLIGFMTAIYY